MQEPSSWMHTDASLSRRLVYRHIGDRLVPACELRPTKPETDLADRQRYLLTTFENHTEGINIQRVENFFRENGLRVAPYRLLNEVDTQRAKKMGELDGVMAGYKASHDLALVPRYTKLEKVNGRRFTESLLVHEVAHGNNEHHDLVYLEESGRIQHGRSGSRVYDNRGEARGLLIEEARAERLRGKFVEQVLGLPQGFVKDLPDGNFFLEDGALVSAKYTIRLANGKPHVITESFVAQCFDLLCQIDPGLDYDLTIAPKSVEGLRNVAKRLNRIKPGLYRYLRDMPFGRDSYKQCLVQMQKLVRSYPSSKRTTPYETNQKTGINAGSLIGG